MKKVLVCALAALFLMATCLTAFAVDYTTTTSYTTDGQLTVTTNVTSAADNEMITYLAYKGTGDAPEKDDDIIYIDQKTWNGTELTFEYTTDKANLTGVKVKSGSSTAATATDMELGARKITVKAEGQDDYVFYLPETVGTHIETTTITVPEGYSLADAAYVEDVNGTVTITDNDALINNTEITVEFVQNEVVNDPTVDVGYGNSFTTTEGETTKDILTVLAKVSTNTTASADNDVCGIILTTDKAAIEDTTNIDTDKAIAYKAVDKNSNGYFAVQLVNTSGTIELSNSTYYARVYAVNSKDVKKYGEIITIDAKN